MKCGVNISLAVTTFSMCENTKLLFISSLGVIMDVLPVLLVTIVLGNAVIDAKEDENEEENQESKTLLTSADDASNDTPLL